MLAEFGFQELDEVGDVPRDGHVAGHGKFRAGEEGFELAEEGRVRLRFEPGDVVAEKGDARRGVGVGRSVQTPVRGENLAGFRQLVQRDKRRASTVQPLNNSGPNSRRVVTIWSPLRPIAWSKLT